MLGYNVLTLQGNEKKVAAIFEAFEHFHLGKESFHHLYKEILAGLDKVIIYTHTNIPNTLPPTELTALTYPG